MFIYSSNKRLDPWNNNPKHNKQCTNVTMETMSEK